MEPELKSFLSEINSQLTQIKNKKTGIWRAFFNGMFSALGYMLGLAVIIVLLAWFLNKIGVLPELQKQAKDFQIFMGSAQKLINGADNNQQPNNTQDNVSGSYMITLPDGTKAKVIPQQ